MEAARAHAAWRARRHFAALDGLRFCAILAVLFLHSPLAPVWAASAGRLFERGFLGVDLFFVISGFLITTLLLRECAETGRISLAGFYRRRALRILPLYLLLVTAVGLWFVVLRQTPDTAVLWPFYYLFMANFLVGDIPLLAPTWSLSVEEQYYLLWPLLLIRLPWRWLLAGVLAYVLIQVAGVHAGFAYAAWRPGPLEISLQNAGYGALLLGSALALLLHRPAGFALLWRWIGHRQAAGVLAGLLLLELLLLPKDLSGWPLLAIHLTMAALLAALVMREDGPLLPVLRARMVVRIGRVSYGIYLLHQIAAHVATLLTDRLPGGTGDNLALHMALYLVLSWLMAEISWRFYESRFLALRHRSPGAIVQAQHDTPAGRKTLP